MRSFLLLVVALSVAAPVSSSPRDLLAESAAAEAAGDSERAWQLAAKAAAEAPADPAVRGRAASAALAAKRYPEAIDHAAAAISTGRPAPAYYQVRSAALAALGRRDEALADADSGLQLNPASAAGRLRRAQALEGLDRRAPALEEYRRAAELDAALVPVFEHALARLSPSPWRRRWPLAAAAVAVLILAVVSTRKHHRSKHVRFGSVIRMPTAGDGLTAGGVIGGHYIVGRPLDRGGSGQQTYEGRDLEDRPRTIRRFLPALEQRRSFRLDQAQAAGALKHQGLTPFEAVFEEGGAAYVVQEPSAGETLAAALERSSGRRFGCEAVLRSIKPLCEALDAAHAAGLVHGRVSPREIVVEENIWRLSGLGLPGIPPADSAPPEGDAPTKESDVYGLGITVYEAVSGEKPFHGAEGPLAKREGRPASLAGRVGLPQGLDAFFSRALAADPARRFHAAGELYLALRTLVTPGVH